MIAWAGVRRCAASSKVWLARSVTWPPQRSRVPGPVALAVSCTSRRVVPPSFRPNSTNCLISSSASSSRLTVHVSTASARLASSPRRAVSAAGRLATLTRDHRSEKAVKGRMRPTAPNWIPGAISRAFSSGRSVVALIAGLESAVLWWNILVRRWAHLLPRRFVRRSSARVPAGAAGPAQAGVLLRSGAECQVAIGG